MGYKLGRRSKGRLKGLHPDIVKVVYRAIEISEVDFTVLEGLRSLTRQKMLLKTGKSKTMNSRHLNGHAVDLGAWVDGTVKWDWPLYHKIASAMKKAATEYGIDLEWGGDWKGFPDGPHFQLSWEKYPNRGATDF
jgi:peptidoglycan L-alanyl-D-glutamate endopeptidase CwlK